MNNAHHSRPPLAHDLSLEAISHASQINNASTHSQYLNVALNSVARDSQTLIFEERFGRFSERFGNASDAVRAHMLREFNRGLELLDKEENNIASIRDPPEMTGPRTFGRGGPRQFTAAEMVERELQKIDRPVLQQSTASEIQIVDLTSPKRPSGPVVMTWSAPGRLIRSSEHQRTPQKAIISQQPQDDVIVIEISPTEIVGSTQITHQKSQISMVGSSGELAHQTSFSRPQRPSKRPSIYQGELVQPRKWRK